jgi:hypothetical protein
VAAWMMSHDGTPHCPHAPDYAGRQCVLCGLRADYVPRGTPAARADREAFAVELTAAYQDAVRRAEGQTSWLGE